MFPPSGEWARPLGAASWECVPRTEDGASPDSLRLQHDAQKLFQPAAPPFTEHTG